MAKKVMMALDYSDSSFQLFSALPDLLKLGMKELLLVNVVKINKDGKNDLEQDRKRFIDTISDRLEELKNQGVKVQVEVSLGTPSEEICRLAIREKCGMVVIGCAGEGSSVKSVFLGASAANVVRGCSVPVLVKKYSEPEENLSSLWDSIVVPVDFSTCSEAVLKWVYSNSQLFSKIHLVHVLDKPEDSMEMADEEKRAIIKLDKWSKKISAKGPQATTFIGKGIASQNILAQAEEKGASLIAMPRRGRGLVAGLVIGSTADAVARRSPIPVFMFPF